ncbi:MAG: cytochrome P450 [Flavobacteriales bacterium]|nr:cytochrome P450 [Flavobacteriales bacterium]
MANSTLYKKLPVKKGHWILGIALDLIRDPLGFLSSVTSEFPSIVTYRFANRHVVYLSDPTLIKHVMQTNNKNYLKGLQYEPLKLVLGNGLLTSEGEFWLRQRRIVSPVFHKKYIVSFANQMVSSTQNLIASWEKEEGKVIDIYPPMMQLTLDIVGLTLFSTNVKDKAASVGPALGVLMEFAINRVRAIVKIPLWFPLPGNMRFRKNKKILDDVVVNIIKKRRRTPSDHIDLLDMLMKAKDEETGEQMTDDQLKDEVMTIFIAGHETTASALTFVWHLLSKNPEKQQKFHEELDRVLEGKMPLMEHVPQLEYTLQIIYEAMRLYPPAWIVARRAINEDVIGEYPIEKDSNVLICPYSVHRNPAIWEQAEEFLPERFEKEKMKEIDKFAYFPFGGGPRMCVGNNFALMEMQLAMAVIGQRYSVENDVTHQVKLDPLVTLRPQNGVKLKLIKRT